MVRDGFLAAGHGHGDSPRRRTPEEDRAPLACARQNLTMLVGRGRVGPAARHWTRCGATRAGGEMVARGALGENPAGDLIYAGSISASPASLAGALARAGARVARDLDINGVGAA